MLGETFCHELDPPFGERMHDRSLAAELVERRREADASLGSEVAHREFGLALAKQAFRRVDDALADRFAPQAVASEGVLIRAIRLSIS